MLLLTCALLAAVGPLVSGECMLPGAPRMGFFDDVNPRMRSTAGQTLKISCDTGFVPSPSDVMTCRADGTWTSVSCVEEGEACYGEEETVFFNFDRLGLCDLPPVPLFGYFVGVNPADTYALGDALTVECNAGYLAVPSNVITCQADGAWGPTVSCFDADALMAGPVMMDMAFEEAKPDEVTPPPLVVPDKMCAFPITPAFGHMQVSGINIGATATFWCDAGFSLTGAGTIHCEDKGQATGSWSDLYPRCTPSADQAFGGGNDEVVTLQTPSNKVCAFPITPAHGHMTVTGTNIGATATFSCDPGFTLTGAGTIHCEDQGRAMGSWSDLYPRCTPAADQAFGGAEDEVIFLPPLQTLAPNKVCAFPIVPANGHMTVTGTNIGATATFWCDAGFSLTGAGTIHCEDKGLVTGSWSDLYPRCTASEQAFAGGQEEITFVPEEQVTCALPSPPLYGYFLLLNPPAVSAVGESVVIECDTGYVTSPSNTITCLEDGTWGPDVSCVNEDSYQAFGGGDEVVTAPPLVVPDKVCMFPITPMHGHMQVSGIKIGDTATFWCDAGFSLIGAGTIHCQDKGQSTGSWSDSFPYCAADAAFTGDDEVFIQPGCRDPDMGDRLYLVGQSWGKHVRGVTYSCECEADQQFSCREGSGIDWAALGFDLQHPPQAQAFSAGSPIAVEATSGCFDPDMGHSFEAGRRWAKAVAGEIQVCECQAAGRGGQRLSCHLAGDAQVRSGPLQLEACYDEETGQAYLIGQHWIEGRLNKVCHCVPGDHIVCQ
ncbi:complement component receptor 1-like protein isoform X6 [Branchiostoma floridae x Branchiostoma belcheri]